MELPMQTFMQDTYIYLRQISSEILDRPRVGVTFEVDSLTMWCQWECPSGLPCNLRWNSRIEEFKFRTLVSQEAICLFIAQANQYYWEHLETHRKSHSLKGVPNVI